MNFYLSGGMEFKTNYGKNWRDWITSELKTRHHDTIDPTKLEKVGERDDAPTQHALGIMKQEGKLDEIRDTVRRVLFRKDMFGIQQSDAMILFYDESVQRGAGTLAEAWESFREGRPIYLVTEFSLADIPTWLIGETTAIFPNFDELLEYIGEHSYMVRDQMEAEKIRDEVLGGVY